MTVSGPQKPSGSWHLCVKRCVKSPRFPQQPSGETRWFQPGACLRHRSPPVFSGVNAFPRIPATLARLTHGERTVPGSSSASRPHERPPQVQPCGSRSRF
jgi:hypothetical protein